MRIGSLFTGYGGLDMATEAAFDATAAWVADIDKGACKVLAHRYPGVPNLGDITVTDWSSVEPVDIITGGSPCQDLSHAGRRAGMTEGTRSNLWVAMREAIAQLRPTYVIWENVRGAYSAAADSAVEPCPGCVGDGSGVHLRALHRVLGDLSDLGYDCQWRGLFAGHEDPEVWHVGAPHKRFRVFVIARLADAASDGRHEGRTESARLLGRSDAAERGGSDGRLTLLPTPAVNDMGKAYTPEQWDAWTAKMQAAHGNGNGHGKSLEIEAARLLTTPSVADSQGGHERRGGERGDELLLNGVAKYELLPTPMVGSTSPAAHGQISGDFRARMDEALARFGRYAPAISRWGSTIGQSPPAPTEPTGRNAVHRLSPRFTEWMMGLPAGWITDVPGVTRNEALKACGNGVVPQQAHAAIADALDAWAVMAA